MSTSKCRRDRRRLQSRLKILGIIKLKGSNENDGLPIVQKYKENPEQYVNKIKSYTNDQNVKNAIKNKVHPYNIVNDICDGNTNLFINIVENKNYSVHDIPNQNGKYKNKKTQFPNI